MFAVLAAILFSVVALLTMLVACGAPLGEFTMGGQFKVLPPSFRIMAGVSLLIQLFAIVIVLQTGGMLPLCFSLCTTTSICFFFAVYLSLNTVLNLLSKSKKENYVMTPFSLLAAICFWATAFHPALR